MTGPGFEPIQSYHKVPMLLTRDKNGMSRAELFLRRCDVVFVQVLKEINFVKISKGTLDLETIT